MEDLSHNSVDNKHQISTDLSEELLAIARQAREENLEDVDFEPRINTPPNHSRLYLENFRSKNNLIDQEGRLDHKEKFEQSAYEVLSLNYYEENIQRGESVEAPRYETDEEFREKYIQRTQDLIQAIKDNEYDTVYFMDKSARPVAWMVRELWDVFTDDGSQMPIMKFINIDANDVLKKGKTDMRPDESETIRFKPSDEQINNIKLAHKSIPENSPYHPSRSKKSLIVDEVSVSGATQVIAGKLMESAYPGTVFDTTTWMDAGKKVYGKRGSEMMMVTELPVWYSKKHVEGRGIGDAKESDNPNLSQPYIGYDIQSEALRTDIKLLAEEIKSGKQSVRAYDGCYETDPVSGKPDMTKSKKYKIARLNNFEIDPLTGKRIPGNGKRIVIDAPK